MHACLKAVVGSRWAESRKVRNKLILDSFSSRDVEVPCDACIVPDEVCNPTYTLSLSLGGRNLCLV